jgi:hypothetical protein
MRQTFTKFLQALIKLIVKNNPPGRFSVSMEKFFLSSKEIFRGQRSLFTRGGRGRGFPVFLIRNRMFLVLPDPGSASGSVSYKYGSGSVSQRYGSEDPNPHPDQYQIVTDPEHWAIFHPIYFNRVTIHPVALPHNICRGHD